MKKKRASPDRGGSFAIFACLKPILQKLLKNVLKLDILLKNRCRGLNSVENKILDNAILQQLKNELKCREVSIGALSKMVDISPSTLYDVLNGRSMPRIDTLIDICDALGLEVYIRRKQSDSKEFFEDAIARLTEEKRDFLKNMLTLLDEA